MLAMVNTAVQDTFQNLIEAVTAKEGWVQTSSTLLSEPHRSEQTDQLLAGVARSVVEYTSISSDVIMRQPEEEEEKEEQKAKERTEKESHYKFGIIHKVGPDASREIQYVIIKKNVKSYPLVKQILNNAFGKDHSVLKRDEALPRDKERTGDEKQTSFKFPPYAV
eukprot:COSAG02_NODE_11882_length_1635_cov_1.891276_1_plen_165_part_00